MKKVLLTAFVVLLAAVAHAQQKIAAQLQNGYKAVYTSEATVTIPGNGEKKIIAETEYLVTDATPEGAVVSVRVTDITSDVPADDLAGQLVLLSTNAFKGITVSLKTDADGKVVQVLNYDEVRNQMANLAADMVDVLVNSNPDLAQMLPKDALLAQITSSATEEKLLQKFSDSGVMALNGKTIANGAQDTYTSPEGMKMKRMYFVAGGNIITNSTLDMSRDDLKAMVIAQIEQQMPDQAAMIRENIDMVMGQMTFELTDRVTYTLQPNGWVKTINQETTQNIMGQSMRQVMVTTLKE